MKETNLSNSACRYCRSYEPEGRRGGYCQILGVPVQGNWKACVLASPPFKTTLKKLEDIFQLETSVLETSLSLSSSSPSETETNVKDSSQQAGILNLAEGIPSLNQ
jgi:hypothetical protein